MNPAKALDRADAGCDAAVSGFALWTLVANAAVFAGAGLDTALLTAAATLGTVGLFRWRARRSSAPAKPSRGTAESSSGAVQPVWRIGVAGLAALVAASYALGAPLTAIWLAGAAVTASLSLIEWGRSKASDSESGPASTSTALFVLALLSVLCLAITLASHRPDADDAFYLNMAVSAADHPAAPLIAGDTLHGVAGVELSLPVYKVHSLELLAAGLSRVTGAPVLTVSHLWLPALVALLVPFAYARLLRLLLPARWLWGVGIALAYLVLAGGGTHGWTNFGLLRLHQGKGMLLTLMLPLVTAYAIEFGRAPSRRRWWQLAASQIAALGLSATALWLAPCVAGLALAAGVPATGTTAARLRRLLAGFATSSYLLALAVMLHSATTAAIRDTPIPIPEAAFTNAELVAQAFHVGAGEGPMAVFTVFAAFAGWAFCSNDTARRFCAFFAAGWMLLWNPFAASWIADHVTGAPTYWRAFWLLPMPMLGAIVLTAPLAIAGEARPWLGRIAVVALTSLLLLGGVRTPPLSAANHVRLDWPGWQVPEAAFEAAQALASQVGPGSTVLAPRAVAPWIPTLHHHPVPLVVRPLYLTVLADHLPPRELELRIALMRLVSGEGRPPHADELLRDAIADHEIRAVCLTRKASEWRDITRTLADAGLQQIFRNADYEVWARAERGAVER